MKKNQCILKIILLAYTVNSYATGLKLDTVLQSVNNYFPLIISERQQLASAKYKVISAKGSFDPNLKLSVVNSPNGYYQNTYADSELSAQIPNSSERVFAGYRLGLGTFPVYQQQNWTYDQGEVRTGIEMPLSRNHAIDSQRAKIQERSFEVSLQTDILNQKKFFLMREASAAYWSWVSEGKKLLVQKNLLSIAVKRQQWIRERVEKGDLPKVDEIDNERIILQRESRIAQQEQFFQNAGLLLSLYVREKNGQPIQPNQLILPQHFSIDGVLNNTNAETDAALLNKNPAIHQIMDKININTVKLKLASNDKKPDLTTKAYVAQDFGTPNPQVNRTTVNLALVYQMPIYRREAKGREESAKYELKSLSSQEDFVSQEIKNKIAMSKNAIYWSKEQITLAEKELTLNIKMQNAENKRFVSGDGNLFVLNQREEMTAENNLKIIDAKQKYYNYLTDYAYYATSFKALKST